MLNSYTQNDRTIASDLKIFIGKRAEIAVLEKAHKIVDKKWYMAWDTGEFFIANGAGKLIRYGGTANNLSKEDIETIVENCTAEQLELIKSQLTSALANYKTAINKIDALDTKVDDSINRLENETTDLIKQKIDELLVSAEAFTYSKTQVNDLLAENKTNTLQEVSDNYISNTEIESYSTKDYVNAKIDTRLAFDTGDNIQKYVTSKLSGYFFCISDSINGSFEMGHTYRLLNGASTDITAEGTGGGYVSPNMTLTVNNESTIIKEIGSDFTGSKTFKYTLSNPKDIKGTLSFYENRTKIDSINEIPRLSGSFDYNATLFNLNVGKYIYALSGEDKKGNTIKGEYTINVLAPIYYGTTSTLLSNVDTIKASNKKIAEIATGRYTFVSQNEEYLFIAVPANINITKISMNGFDIPMATAETIYIPFKDYNIEYKYYISKTMAEAGTFIVDIL